MSGVPSASDVCVTYTETGARSAKMYTIARGVEVKKTTVIYREFPLDLYTFDTTAGEMKIRATRDASKAYSDACPRVDTEMEHGEGSLVYKKAEFTEEYCRRFLTTLVSFVQAALHKAAGANTQTKREIINRALEEIERALGDIRGANP